MVCLEGARSGGAGATSVRGKVCDVVGSEAINVSDRGGVVCVK